MVNDGALGGGIVQKQSRLQNLVNNRTNMLLLS
jgi:hypothetical protein